MNENKRIITAPVHGKGTGVNPGMGRKFFAGPAHPTFPYLIFPTPHATPVELLGELAASRAASKAVGRRVSLSSLQEEYAQELTNLVSSLVGRR